MIFYLIVPWDAVENFLVYATNLSRVLCVSAQFEYSLRKSALLCIQTGGVGLAVLKFTRRYYLHAEMKLIRNTLAFRKYEGCVFGAYFTYQQKLK